MHHTLQVGAPLAWLLYALVPLDRFKMFKDYEHDEVGEEGEEGGGDTGGMRYDEVTRRKQIEMEPYVCPMLTKRIFDALVEEEEYARANKGGGDAESGAPAAAKAGEGEEGSEKSDADDRDCMEVCCTIS